MHHGNMRERPLKKSGWIDELHCRHSLAPPVDGNRFYAYKKVPHQTIIKGDGQYANIAAASILAKTARDKWMQKLHAKYPQYGWDKNKGYGTAAHRAAIAQLRH
ncbi:MAG: hypothetical protein EBW54_04000, partial [Betaproteobacteria bacterium]|nr:hypothetical protein [Betaproteobacteria bacterium]